MELVRPGYLLVALAAVPIVMLAYAAARVARRRALARLLSSQHLERLAFSEGAGRYYARAVLASLGIALSLCALARPRWGTRLEVVTRKGVDIVVALDTSLSMLSEDVKPNRLELAKREVADLIDHLAGDRIGIVAFAGDAYVACPLTLDMGAAKMFLSDLGPNTVGSPGTAVGDAIRKGVAAFGRKEQKHKVLVLMTDGEDHQTDPLGAAKDAKEAGVVIHAIGFGTGGGAPIPLKEEGTVTDYKRDGKGDVVVSRLDETMLAGVAAYTGGGYYRASPAQAELDRVMDDIGKMDKTELSQKLYALKEERFQYPLIAGLLLLLIEAALRASGSSARRGRNAAMAGARSAKAVAAALLVLLLAGRSGSAAPLPLTGAAPEVERGNRLYEEGKLDEAMAAYARARAKVPDAPEVTFDVGNVLYRQEKLDEARKEYERAAGASDTGVSTKAQYNIGNTLFRKGDMQGALAAYEKAIRQDPTDLDAKWNYELVKQKLQQQQQQQEQDEKEPQPKDQQDQQKQDENQDRKDQDQQEPRESDEQEKEQQQDEAQQQREQGKSPRSDPGDEERPGDDDKRGQGSGGAEQGQLSEQQAERFLDAFLQLEREAKRDAEEKRTKARLAATTEDW